MLKKMDDFLSNQISKKLSYGIELLRTVQLTEEQVFFLDVFFVNEGKFGPSYRILFQEAFDDSSSEYSRRWAVLNDLDERGFLHIEKAGGRKSPIVQVHVHPSLQDLLIEFYPSLFEE